MKTLKIVRKTPTATPVEVYDFTVEGDHHYILGNGLISHNSYVPAKEMSGGSGLKYAATTIVYLSKKKFKDGDEVVGNIIHCKTHKSRLTKENRTIDVLLNYDSGLDRHYGLIELGIKHGVLKKVSTKVQFPDGRSDFESRINKEPQKWFTPDVIKALDEAAAREFKYGQGDSDEEAKDE
jgi:hypothetical protein